MKKTILIATTFLSLTVFSCKEKKATEKIDNNQVEMATERDQAAKK